MHGTHASESGLGFLLHDVSRLLRRGFDRRVGALGLTQAQWRAIAHLSRNQGIKQAALADILEVRPITLTRLIDRLAASAWVERRPDPDDRRAVRLFLTAKAQPILAKIEALAAEIREEALAGLSPDRRRSLVEALQAMKRSLLDSEAASPPPAPVSRKGRHHAR